MLRTDSIAIRDTQIYQHQKFSSHWSILPDLGMFILHFSHLLGNPWMSWGYRMRATIYGYLPATFGKKPALKCVQNGILGDWPALKSVKNGILQIWPALKNVQNAVLGVGPALRWYKRGLLGNWPALKSLYKFLDLGNYLP